MDASNSTAAVNDKTATTTAVAAPRRQLVQTLTADRLRRLLEELSAPTKHGRACTPADRLAPLRELAAAGALQSYERLLSAFFSLNGKPLEIKDHAPFEPMFRALMPERQVWVAGRQVGKTQSSAARIVALSACIPNFRTLCITPLYEQIRRFSSTYIRPLIDNSPLRPLWLSTTTDRSVLQRSFRNGSLIQFSFALLDADRCRGISTHYIDFDETQDLDPHHFGVLTEALSHSPWRLRKWSGTPKSLDGPLQGLFNSSSQAEWFIPCRHGGCGAWNIPSTDYHLLQMIGPLHPHIGEKYPGTVCWKCRKPINPRHGHWVHRQRDKRWSFPGYHVPQLLLPLHFASLRAWSELLAKQAGAGNMTEAMFLNEVLGVSADTGQKLVTETELKAACTLPWKNNPKHPDPAIRARLRHYSQRILAIDWGGGGETGVSHTALALMGFTPTGKIDVLWGARLLYGADHLKEAKAVIELARMFNVDYIAHDYTGAGTVRDTVLIQSGYEEQRIFSVTLQRTAHQDLMVYRPPTPLHHRRHYQLDKVRSLLYTCQAIKLGVLRFFCWDRDGDDAGLVGDFLALVSEKTETRLAGDIFTIVRNLMLSDDFAQAVNIGAAALWYVNDAWPNFAQLAGFGRITQQQVYAAGNAEYGWAEDLSEPFFNLP